MKRLTVILTAILLTSAISAQVDYDKKLHAGAGVVIGTWGTLAGNSLDLKPGGSALFGIASATVAGLGKELWDEIEYGGFDVKDFGATMIGGAVGVGLSYLGLKIFKKSKPYYAAVNGKITIGVKVWF